MRLPVRKPGPPTPAAWLPVLAVLLAILVAPAAHAVDPTQMPTPQLEARYLALTHELRCVQCQDETIADSPADIAGDLRREVRDMLLAGKSDDDVRSYMRARYGDYILYRPRFVWRNAWLWGAPFILLAVGILVASRILKQRSALVDQDNEPVEEDTHA